MKTHTKTTLQKLVFELMSQADVEMSQEQIIDWTDRLPQIQQDIFKVMRFLIFGQLSLKLISRHMNQIQKECTLMLDVLYGYNQFSGQMQDLKASVMTCLFQILDHQQLRYGKYFDTWADMPVVLYLDAAKRIELKASLMVTAMTRYHADKRLQAVVVGKMTNLLKRGNGCWHQIYYLERLHGSIMELCIGYNGNITPLLRSLLLRANFNTTGFIAYCKEGIDNKLAENYDLQDQYNCLFNYKSEFSRLTYKNKFNPFEPFKPELKEVLLQYVNSELHILKFKNNPIRETVVTQPLVPHKRLPVSITVDMLAYFFRLLYATGVVTGHKSELLLFISKNFCTPGSGLGDISLKSLENKYKQVVNKNAIAVKSILLKMLKQLNEEFA